MTDGQLYDLLKGYHEAMVKSKGNDMRNEAIGKAVIEWKKTHTGEPDYFNDIIPMLNKV